MVLDEDEYIRLVGFSPNSTFNHYLKTVQQIKNEIVKYRSTYNLFIGLATVKGEGGKVENMRARKAIMLDFDKKDFPEYKTVQDFTAHIKARIPNLFVHMIVDTGHGYHFYIAINRCVDTARVASINKSIAEITGADIKATLPTQIARIPTSFNLKDSNNRKPVSIVTNALERAPSKFRSYHLQKLEGMIERIKQNEHNIENVTPLPKGKYTRISSYHCICCMLAEGVEEGARNFCLGRIVNYLKSVKGFSRESAFKTVCDWNCRCTPPKSKATITDEFNRYWESDYKLLGCQVPDAHDQEILNRYCDKFKCTSIFEQRKDSEINAQEMYFDNNILRNKVMRDLTGFHYLILSVLDFVDKPVTKKNLISHLTGRQTKKCCISAPTLRKILNELIDKGYIIVDDTRKTYQLNHKTYKPTYTKYSYSATIQFINKIITPCEYLVYLCLVRNLQQNKNVTYETIADNLDKDERNIGKYIKGLHKAGLLNIDVAYNERGVLYNNYRLLY